MYTHVHMYRCVHIFVHVNFSKYHMCIIVRFYLKFQNFPDVEMGLTSAFWRLGKNHGLKPGWATLQDPVSKNKNKQDIMDRDIRTLLLWIRPCKFEPISNTYFQQGRCLSHICTQAVVIWNHLPHQNYRKRLQRTAALS